jgi:hypothetical protein
MYFLAMVAVDHRTHVGNRVFRRVVSGEEYSGSLLLWRLGRLKLSEDPNFFTPRSLSSLDPLVVRDWLTGDYGPVWDYGVRAYLLMDIGRKLRESPIDLFNVDSLGELINRLRRFVAYEDPVNKKSLLLAKFLIARGLLRIPKEELELPVDNHLTRIAYRLGIVELHDSVLAMVRNEEEVGRELDVKLRMTVKDAWNAVVRMSKADPVALDDFLWRLGRTVCIKDRPNCTMCPIRRVCKAYGKQDFINEHRHTVTYYY